LPRCLARAAAEPDFIAKKLDLDQQKRSIQR